MLKGYYRHEKTGEMQTPPFFFNLSLQIQSINQSIKYFPQKEKRL